jgi:hypothetical protein
MSVDVGGSLTAAEPPSQVTEADYDGTTPFTGGSGPPATFQGRVRAGVTAMVVGAPFAGLGVAAWLGLTGSPSPRAVSGLGQPGRPRAAWRRWRTDDSGPCSG